MTRSDPQGKRALFESPPITPAEPVADDPFVEVTPPEGKAALFSAGPHQPGTVVLECSECGVHSRMTTIEAGVRILAISLWVPGRRYSRWMLCPECERRTWCRIHWFG